jgi:hypothetical protein
MHAAHPGGPPSAASMVNVDPAGRHAGDGLGGSVARTTRTTWVRVTPASVIVNRTVPVWSRRHSRVPAA